MFLEDAFDLGGTGKRQNKRQRGITVSEVRPGWLARPVAVAGHIKHIVNNLEGHTQAIAGLSQALHHLRRSPGKMGSYTRSLGKQRGGFTFDDFQIIVPRHARVVAQAVLQDFSFGQADAGVRRPGNDLFLKTTAQCKGSSE